MRPAATRTWTRDHPRSRGEHGCGSWFLPSEEGSSPLTRGAPDDDTPRSAEGGIIPAHAGSTRWRPSRAQPSEDHPRSRGEHLARGKALAPDRGSSPLTRGALGLFVDPHLHFGIIPAHAGSTAAASSASASAADHPRSRGEHAFGLPEPDHSCGSSPLTRGAHPLHIARFDQIGIIPAHAGSTSHRCAPCAGCRGSSPLTRGARQATRRRIVGVGIIPAHAGSTRLPDHPPGRARDHPRSRGEHPFQKLRNASLLGSSPLTRGARDRGTSLRRPLRIIPAHAGSTRSMRWWPRV